MADRAISNLTRANSMTNADLFAISQGGQAKSVTWETFYSDLATALDGHGGISSIVYTPPESGSLNGTITISYADQSTPVSIPLANGKGIESITKTGTSGLTDTYTITYNNGDTEPFYVTNGRGISSISMSSSGLTDTYTITYNDDNTYSFDVDNGRSVISITDYWAVSADAETEPQTYDVTIPELSAENKYLWHYQVVSFNSGPDYETAHGVVGTYGDTGQAWYVWVRYSEEQPSSDEEVTSIPSNWMGIYSGTEATAPKAYTSYDWFQIKGAKGDTGVSITDVSLYSQSGLTDTYRITFSDGTSTTFEVTNGNGIQSISRTGTSGLVDTYTITLTDGSSTQFTVTNGDYIDPVVSYGTSTAVAIQPVTWYDNPSSISYTAGNFIWRRTQFTMHAAQTVQSTKYEIIGYIGQNGSGSGTVTQVTFNGSVFSDDGTGNVSISVDPDDVGAIENPATKLNGQVLTYDSTADKWVASTPTTGNVNTVNNVGVTAGTTNIALDAAHIPTSDSSNVQTHVDDIEDIVGNGSLTGFTATDLTGAANELRSGKVAKSGDTMTGPLSVPATLYDTSGHQKGVTVTTPDVSESVTPGSNVWIRAFDIHDANDKQRAYFDLHSKTNGQQGLQIETSRDVNGSTVYNKLALEIDSSGNRAVSFADAGIWRKALELGTNGALPITAAQGGTGVTKAGPNTVFAGPSSGTANAAPSFRDLVAADIPNLNASKITAGTVAVGRGGTGMSDSEQITTIASIVTAGTNITINSAYYAHWGKMAMIRIQMISTAAQAAGTKTLGTLVSGKRPIQQASANVGYTDNAYINANGEILYNPALTANQQITVVATYILA